MTLSGPSIPTAMAEANNTCLLSIDELDLHLLAGRDFDSVADSVGLLREATYRQQLSGSGDERDLDGRDAHYDHLLLVERSSGELAGAARLQFIPAGATELPGSEGSYLEHVYPGIKAQLAQQQNHLEIGRVALAQRFQRQPHSLMALFRGGDPAGSPQWLRPAAWVGFLQPFRPQRCGECRVPRGLDVPALSAPGGGAAGTTSSHS